MSSSKTPKLKLHSWEPTDIVKRTEFNDNFNKIDEKTGEIEAIVTETSGKVTEVSNNLTSVDTRLTEQLAQIITLDSVNMILQGVPTSDNGYANTKINEIISLIQSGVLVNKTLDFKGYSIDLNDEIVVPWGINVLNVTAKIYHTTKNAFRFQGRHIVHNVAFNYPNQDMTGQNIITYPAAITCDSTMGYSAFTNINLGNAYRGIDFSNGVSGGTLIYNVWGYPLYRGIMVNKTIDVMHIDRVHFNPNYYGSPNVRLKSWVWQNGIAVECGRYDFGNVNRVFTWGYFAPFKVTSSPTGGSANNIKFTNWIADACQQFCVFEYHDGGLLFENGTGVFYNPFVTELTNAGLPIPTQASSIGYIRGGGSGQWGGKIVHFKNNRIYRAENHGIWAENPIMYSGNELINYANSLTEESTSVVDGLQLRTGSEGSIVTESIFDGKNKAQNRCIAITTTDGNHKIDNNQLLGWKSTDVYGRENNGTFDGVTICTTAKRPTKGLYKGMKIFDTTLNGEFVWDGSSWTSSSVNGRKTITSPNASADLDVTDIAVLINNGDGQYVVNKLTGSKTGQIIQLVNAGSMASVVFNHANNIATPNGTQFIVDRAKNGATLVCTDGANNAWKVF